MLTATSAQSYHCPRWQELPGIPLYMDQVLLILQNALGVFSEDSEPIITPAMINNYVKQKLIDPPQKKKYERGHIAQLIVLTLCKKVFSMSEITAIMELLISHYGIEAAYDLFCDDLEEYIAAAFMGKKLEIHAIREEHRAHDLLRSALMALSCKLLVLGALAQGEDE